MTVRGGAVLLLALVLVAATAPLVAPYPATARAGAPFERPSAEHILGTNDVGQDLFSQLLTSARSSLALGLLAAAAATLLGVTAGLTATLLGGLADSALMRVADVTLAVPSLPLLILLGAYLGTGRGMVVLVIAALMWAGVSRVIRAQALAARTRAHVVAARAMGGGRAYVLRRHLFPAVFPIVVPQFVRAAGAAIVLDASIDFLGLGNPTTISWGTMLYYANARNALLTDAWLWWVVPPGLCIAATVLALGLVGYRLEEQLRPRLRHDWRPGTGVVGRAAGAEGSLPQPAPAPALQVDRMTVRYGSEATARAAVDAVSMAVHQGEIVGLVGESGSGKTSLIHAAIGLLKPPARASAARVCIDGRDLHALTPRERRHLRGRHVALVPQNAMNALNPVRTVMSQVIEAIRVHAPAPADAARDTALSLLEAVGLDPGRANAYPHELSGGMRQRVAIAMALAHNPRLLVADEPTTGLDVVTAHQLSTLLTDLHGRLGMAMLIVTHDLAFAAGLAGRLVVMRGGRVVEEGTTSSVVCDPTHPYTRRLVDAAPRWPESSGDKRGPAPTSPRKAAEPPVLSLTQVTRTFDSPSGPVRALDAVTLEVARGESVGVVGASGAGKSTLARLALALEHPDAGAVRWNGEDVRMLRRGTLRRLRRRYHLIFQDPYDALPPVLRVDAIVAEPLVVQGIGDRRQPVWRALEAVALDPGVYGSRFAHELSGGERQRVALARALVLEPACLVADEPTSLLDTTVKADLVTLLGDLRRARGLTLVYITHDVTQAVAVTSRLLVLASGRVVDDGPAARVAETPQAGAEPLISAARAASAALPSRRGRPAPPGPD